MLSLRNQGAVAGALVATIWLCGAGAAPSFAAAKARPAPSASATPAPGKVVLELAPVPELQIDVPSSDTGQPFYDFGSDFHDTLVAGLNASGNYIIYEPTPGSSPAVSTQALAMKTESTTVSPPPEWASTPIPGGTISFQVDALTFQTGDYGDRMLYGFNERLDTPFNNGSGTYANEFPMRILIDEPSWFDRAFDDKGVAPFDSLSGLDLGQGFSLDVLMAYLTVNYASYHSEMRVRVQLDSPLIGLHEYHEVSVSGSGFYFDVSGGYLQYSGAIMLARSNALQAAFTNLTNGALSAIERLASDAPLTAQIDQVQNGVLYLGTGENANVAVGTLYAAVTDPSLVVQVTQSVPSGALGSVVSGNAAEAVPGLVLVEQDKLPASSAKVVGQAVAPSVDGAHVLSQTAGATGTASAPVLTASEDITLPSTNLPETDLSSLTPGSVDSWQAFLDSIVDAVTLPYRIWRYYQYDQSYQTGQSGETSGGTQAWAAQAASQTWAKQIGLDTAPAMDADGPVVAIIDSGIDYNHPAIHDQLWINPSPTTDADGNTDNYGWDFISGDPRPFDDNYHGTEVAGTVLAVAPRATVMPLKVFNPWGVTSSAAMYAAFHYAVDHGAKIIVCGWASLQSSRAIEMGIQYAQSAGVAVVVAAGDRGGNLEDVYQEEFPAVLSEKYDNMITVASVDSNDQLVTVFGAYSNSGPSAIGIAAPGENIPTLEPRGNYGQATNSAQSAAMVAGALARLYSAQGAGGTGQSPPQEPVGEVQVDWPAQAIQTLRDQADTIPSLESQVQGGLRLHIRN